MSRARKLLSGHSHTPVAALPGAPVLGETAFKDGILYIWADVAGLTTWMPLNSPQSTYVHSQGVASVNWFIMHGLGTDEVIIAVYDEDNNVVDALVTNVQVNGVWHSEVAFTSAVVGHAVVFATTQITVPRLVAESMTITGDLTVQGVAVASIDDVASLINDAPTIAGIPVANYITVDSLIDLGLIA